MKEADAAWRAFSERLFDQNKFAIKLGLDSMRAAFEAEGDPQSYAPAIVVGGTNGKGGTSARIAAILEAHGLRTGFYSSPHLIEVRERFRISGRPVARDVALRHGRDVIDRWGNPDTSDPCLTFFELTTLMAARIFAEAKVDVAIWEVGLGGRLDAVNAIEPALTVITSIGFDHQQYLGDSIEEIAAEKAALIRPDVPTVIAHQEFDQARQILVERTRSPVNEEAGVEERGADHQPVTDAWNSAAAFAAARQFLEGLDMEFHSELAHRAASSVTWWGRMEQRTVELAGRQQTFFIDAAHNAQGAQRFFDWLGDRPVGAFVFGAMADKDLVGLTAGIAPSEAPWVHPLIDSPRAASTDILRSVIGRDELAAAPTRRALEIASQAADGRPVVVFGSLYLLGECYAAFGFGADDFAIFDQLHSSHR